MSKPLSEVYKPSSGPLMIRDNLAENMIGGTERLLTGNQRLLTGNQRPQTNSGYRFGQKSLNSFFTRHNPHPGRVRHFKGNSTSVYSVFYSILKLKIQRIKFMIRPKKKNCLFPVTRPTLPFHCRPYVFLPPVVKLKKKKKII